jgi:thiosulfate/3-mercaptopyruvate sulfurtransferase
MTLPFSTPVVTSTWLAAQLTEPAKNLVVIDCRFSLADPSLGQQQYASGHIPGAYYLDLNQDLSGPVQTRGGRHPLPEPAQLANKIAAMGVTPETLIVAYDDSRFAFAARLWWLMRWLGHTNVALLDGGFRTYQQAGYPLSQEVPPKVPGTWQPQPHWDWVVDIDTIKASQNLPNTVLIDSREPERYRGEREPIDPIAGHIPGAVNYPWQEVTDSSGRLRPAVELQAHWAKIQTSSQMSDSQIMVYCGSGVTACVNLLALEAAGIQGAKLYAGSWSDWCAALMSS